MAFGCVQGFLLIALAAFLQLTQVGAYNESLLARRGEPPHPVSKQVHLPVKHAGKEPSKKGGPLHNGDQDITIVVFSDSHVTSNSWKLDQHLPSGDVLIFCGDFSDAGRRDQYELFYNLFKNTPAKEKIIIAGNHDFTLDRKYFETAVKARFKPAMDEWSDQPNINADKENDDANAVWLERTKKDNIHFLQHSDNVQVVPLKWLKDWKKTLTIYASPLTSYFHDYGFAFYPDQNPFAKWTEPVDLMITHGPPLGRLDLAINPDGSHQNIGSKALWDAVSRVKPAIHMYGHNHPPEKTRRMERWSWVANKLTDLTGQTEVSISSLKDRPDKPDWGKETLFINAAILDNTQHQAYPATKVRWKVGPKYGIYLDHLVGPGFAGAKAKQPSKTGVHPPGKQAVVHHR